MADPGPAEVRLRRRGVIMVEQGGRGGVSDYTGNLSAALSRRGIPVLIATADDHLYPAAPGVRFAPIFHYARGHGALARLARRARAGKIVNGLRFLASLPELMRQSRSHAVVHVQGFEHNGLGLLATLALRGVGARVVYTAHNTFERGHDLDGTRVLGTLAHATIVHTAADVARVPGRVWRIPHGHYNELADAAPTVDPAAARAALGLDPGALVVLLFGVLRPDKGLGDLLEALGSSSAWHALVTGEDHGALGAAATQLADPDLAGRVTLREGFLPADAVARAFAAADLVVLPYRRASQSGALLLAYGFRRPVLVYPVGGLTEAVLDGETGWVCDTADPRGLADALGRAAGAGPEEMRRRGERGRAWSREVFGWDAIAARTEAAYATVINGGAAPSPDDAA